MKKTTASFLISAVLLVGLLSCQLDTPAPAAPAKVTQSTLKVSTSIIDVPSSLSGDSATRNLASDALVASSVQGYYTYAKNQVVVAGQAGKFVKGIIQAVEALGLIGKTLDITDTNATTGVVHKWTSLGQSQYRLEKWTASPTSTANKVFELNLTYRQDSTDNTQASGSFIVQVANAGWAASATGEKAPDWIKIDFDSSKAGATWMKVSVLGYRSFADLGTTNTMNTIIELTRDSAGVVTAVSNSSVPGSRHFVWNGYTKNNANVDTLNAASTAETRFYLFKGKATASNLSTVSLAMAKAGYAPATVYSDYSIGSVIQNLIRDRLVNNYDFDGSSTATSDLGNEVIKTLNAINLAQSKPQLNTTDYTANTAANVLTALTNAQASPAWSDPQWSAGKTIVDYLVSMMNVANPAFFDTTVYKGNGTAPAATWFPASDLDSLTPPTEAAVTGLTIAFVAP